MISLSIFWNLEFEASIQRVIACTVSYMTVDSCITLLLSLTASLFTVCHRMYLFSLSRTHVLSCVVWHNAERVDCTFYQVLHFSVLIQKRTTVRSSYKNYCELLFERHANCSLETFRDFRRGENRLKFPHTRRFSLSISVPLHSTKARSDSQGTSRETSAKFHGEIKAQFHPLIIVKRYRQPFVSRR